MTATGLCSMATRAWLAELAPRHGVAIEATGGVDAARRVRAGEAVDLVVLADAVMRALATEGHIVAESLTPVAVSSIALAVRDDTPPPSLDDTAAVQTTLRAAPRIGYSTGPSGDHLLRLIERFGLRETLAGRLIQAPPGTPVGRLLAEGQVDLAIQQRSELIGIPGIIVIGGLPPELAADTVFTAGLTRAADPAAAAFVAYLASPDVEDARLRHGLVGSK